MQTFTSPNVTAKNPACVAHCFLRLLDDYSGMESKTAESDFFYLLEYESSSVCLAFAKTWMLREKAEDDDEDRKAFHRSVRETIKTLLCQPVICELITRVGGLEKLCEES